MTEDIYKLEPFTLNEEARLHVLQQNDKYVARFRFMNEISKRMEAMNGTILHKVKYSLDKMEFARNHSLDQPMDRVIDFFKEAQKELAKSIADFNQDIEAIDRLIDVAGKIRDSERGEGDNNN